MDMRHTPPVSWVRIAATEEVHMRVAALYDIHGNLPALEAVMAEVRTSAVDRIVVGGDVLPGPMPREALACLIDAGIPIDFILGNGEVAALAERAGRPSGVPEAFRDGVRWSGAQLHAEDERAIAAWPRTLRVEIDGIGDVLFCHATPRNEQEIFTRLTAEDRLRPIFDGLGVALVVCGHTHMPFDRTVGRTRVVNAGSVGMPFGRTGADWLLLERGVGARHTAYDLARAADRIRATAYPKAEEFAARSILDPPSEAQMLAVYAKAELS
jgi:predicted phosphodiesterase